MCFLINIVQHKKSELVKIICRERATTISSGKPWRAAMRMPKPCSWMRCKKNTTGDPEKLVSGYLSHIRRFRLFLASDGTAEEKTLQPTAPAAKSAAPVQYRRKSDVDVPTPSEEQVEYYLARWDELENYHLQ